MTVLDVSAGATADGAAVVESLPAASELFELSLEKSYNQYMNFDAWNT